MTLEGGSADQPLVRNVLRRMDDAWATFHDRVQGMPNEHLELAIGEGAWTRKQMLAHITAWHDLTVDRLTRFADSGEPIELADDEDTINARTARTAVGRTTGEIVLGTSDSYRRLRREVARLSDAQLAAHDGWASAIIAGNTFDHYAEHLADLES
jgi:hypothetical protein